MRIDIARAAELLRENDDILVLCHAHPDGDTLGCGYALMHMLQSLGKRCRLECADEIAPKYSFMAKGLEIIGDFEPKFITAVDVADIKLLSDESAEKYSGRVDLCIDHHGSNTEYAKEFCVDSTAAACAEILCPLADELGVEITPAIANCLYTGISTDTGCFKFSNTTSNTHRTAAALIEAGADVYPINKLFFDTKSFSRLRMEAKLTETMEFYADGTVGVCVMPKRLLAEFSATEDDLDSISGFARSIEGVRIGVMIREVEDGLGKISLRTEAPYDAAQICGLLGGGGHAAGASVPGGVEGAKAAILQALRDSGVKL